MNSFFDFKINDINGIPFDFNQLKGKSILIVNTASECGFTPQFEMLQELYQNKKSEGLIILGMPCNDFGGQDPGSESEILEFCQSNYGVTFPMMEKVKINSQDIHPLYKWLYAQTNQKVEWNFHKYLVLNNGADVFSFKSSVSPFDSELFDKI
ncbi:MAG: glutathione peroxidase [Crocinitomicaceae bacterium]